MPPIDAVWSSLQHIQGTSASTPTEHRLQLLLQLAVTVAETSLQRWTISDLYRGISPHNLAEVQEHLIKIKITVAENMAHRFCMALEEDICQGVRRTRCMTLTTWEKQNGVTLMKKRTTPTLQPGAGFENEFRQDAKTRHLRLLSRSHKTHRQDLPVFHGHNDWVRHFFAELIPRKKETRDDGEIRRCWRF
jgi:hypothetical protein